MNNELIILPLAKDNIDRAFQWYESQSAGLGHRFLEEVETCLESVRCYPDSFETIRAHYHRALVKIFPYAVYFERQTEKVIVYAVIHTSRHARAWQRRLH